MTADYKSDDNHDDSRTPNNAHLPFVGRVLSRHTLRLVLAVWRLEGSANSTDIPITDCSGQDVVTELSQLGAYWES